jgi:alpha-N-arabinofuranosidase
MRPEYYADLYAQYATFIKTPADNTPLRVASGGHGDLQSWTEALMTHPTAPPFFDAISLHHYTLPTGSWTGAKGAAIGFPETEWASTMMRTLRMEDILTSHGAIMDAADPDKRVGLYVDEWGTWYDAEPGDNDAFLYQQNTLRDAIVAALNLNIFHAHADRVHMTNIAQMVNVLQAMILTDGPRMVMTPTYHVFEMYRPFQDATSLPVTVSAPAYVNGEISLASVSASAARTEDGALVLALVNLNPNAAALVTTRIEGAAPTRVDGRILTAPAMDAHNTFDAPAQLQPQPFANVQIDGETLTLLLPEKSVLVLTLR